MGPEAVVLNVRKLPPEGLARLWQKPRIEVTAALHNQAPKSEAPAEALAELRSELAAIKQSLTRHQPSAVSRPATPPSEEDPEDATLPNPRRTHLRIAEVLERSGLLPAHVHRVLDAARVGPERPGHYSTAAELASVRETLTSLWPPPPSYLSNCHVFVGPPGSGKTTALCRWLAQTVLIEGRTARVLRLDGQVANTAEALSVLAEVLNVPIERCCPDSSAMPSDESVFVDLPGVTVTDRQALENLSTRLSQLPEPQVHLVLNAAYEQGLLLAQARAFRGFPVTDVILSHIDEDCRWAKLWNLVLGTNYTVGFLSGGQNVPGEFHPPNPEALLGAQFPRK